MGGILRAGKQSEVTGAKQPPAKAAADANEAGPAIGAYLRSQRELRGIEIADLAALTRIPERSLERLEAGYFDGQVDGFVRGFVRTVGEGLGLDPDDTLGRMLSEPTPESRTGSVLSTRVLRASLGLALAAGLAMGALGLREWWWPVGGRVPVGQRQELVQRRDPVRALADAQGAATRARPIPDSGPSVSAPGRGQEESPVLRPKRP